MDLHVQETPAGLTPVASADAIEMPDISQLIAGGRLTLHCQRVVPVGPESGLKAYYEVLLGVRDASGRIGPPGNVITAAERAGTISELDRWVVVEALRWMGKHSATLSDAKLARFVAEKLRNSRIPRERIMFEVTESSAIERLSAAREFIESLRALGCRFAIDDFGAGYASLLLSQTAAR